MNSWRLAGGILNIMEECRIWKSNRRCDWERCNYSLKAVKSCVISRCFARMH